MNPNIIIFLSFYIIIGFVSFLLLNLWDFVLGREIFGPRPVFSFSLSFWRDYLEDTLYWWSSDWSVKKAFFVTIFVLFWPVGDIYVFVQFFQWLMDKVDDALIEKYKIGK